MKVLDGEILFLYDAKMANPNGDPDEENKPRMDYATHRALVSDVRLKRYLRDYWLDQGKDVWVHTLDGQTVTADERVRGLAKTFEKEKGTKIDLNKIKEKMDIPSAFTEWLLCNLIDIRLFGATITIKGNRSGEGATITFTGPVQFAWGYSLHQVEIVESATISSTFAGRESEFGTFGKDWRLYYGLIGFSGRVSRRRGEATGLQEAGLDALEDALLRAIPTEATTRSKYGQTPRLYLHVRFKEGAAPFPPLGDLRDRVRFVPKEGIAERKVRGVEDYTLDLSELRNLLQTHASAIEETRLWLHPELRVTGFDGLPAEVRVG